MFSLSLKFRQWVKYRRQIEREDRILVVEDDPIILKQLEDYLNRQRIPAQVASTPDLALEMLEGQTFAIILISEGLSGLGGLYLLRKIRATYPQIDALIISSTLTMELVTNAFELRVLDIIRKPLDPFELFGRQLRKALQRSVDRRIRTFMMGELRDCLKYLDPKTHHETTAVLEQHLAAMKDSLCGFDRILVVEQDDPEMRQLSESLLLSGMHVEAVSSFQEGLQRVASGDIHLLVLNAVLDEQGLEGLLAALRMENPLTELMLVSYEPNPGVALSALRLGAAIYLVWPPPSHSAMELRLRDILHRSWRDRLMENLLSDIFQQVSRAVGDANGEVSFGNFQKLIGLNHIPRPIPTRVSDEVQWSDGVVAYLDEVLDNLLSPEDEPHITQEILIEEALAAQEDLTEKRASARVTESQFIRFRTISSASSVLALMGDISEGGLFIRTPELVIPGTIMEVDANVEYHGQGFLVRCRGQVAWVAKDNKQFPLGPGFGISFLDPPPDVAELLKEVVAALFQERVDTQ